MPQRTYTSAIERLAGLPEVFTGGDLTVLFGWKSGIASTYLANWRRAGLVKSLGRRSDVHMNLLRNREVNPELALRRVYPQAIKLGVDVLREAGWTTQIPARAEVAVPASGAPHALDGFEITTRTAKWFARVAPGIERTPQGMDRLRPAWALADMIARAKDARVRGAWLLDPADIELAAVRGDSDTLQALVAFALQAACVDEAGYSKLYDTLRRTRRVVPAHGAGQAVFRRPSSARRRVPGRSRRIK